MVECACDPPGSGEEFCTGHCVLRAENERLRGTLEFALDNDRKQSENAARLIAEIERLRAQLGAAKRLIEIVRAREIGTAGGVGAAFEAYDALGDANGS